MSFRAMLTRTIICLAIVTSCGGPLTAKAPTPNPSVIAAAVDAELARRAAASAQSAGGSLRPTVASQSPAPVGHGSFSAPSSGGSPPSAPARTVAPAQTTPGAAPPSTAAPTPVSVPTFTPPPPYSAPTAGPTFSPPPPYSAPTPVPTIAPIPTPPLAPQYHAITGTIVPPNGTNVAALADVYTITISGTSYVNRAAIRIFETYRFGVLPGTYTITCVPPIRLFQNIGLDTKTYVVQVLATDIVVDCNWP